MASFTPTRALNVLARPSSFARTSLQIQHIANKRWSATGPSPSTRAPRSHRTRGFGRLEADDYQPSYEPPKSGLLSYLPRPWIPYAELIRLDKPTGTYYLFLPCLFSTFLAAPLTHPITPPSTLIATSSLFFAGALIMRGAGCTVNDLWDRNLDPHVARTRLRPIARGAISVQQAVPFLGVQLLAGLGILLQFPASCLLYGIPSLILVATYPLAKRVTNYPQFILGLTFSWGAIMGFPALGLDLLSNTPALISASCLYASCVAWTVVYDMIYAYQDIRDDAAAGIKSIALAQEANAKVFLASVSAVQVALLAGAGVAVGAGPVFFVGTCGGAAATLVYMIRKVDLKSVEDCWGWFKRGAWFTGGAISMGLLGEYLARYFGVYEERETVERGARFTEDAAS
ncbi:Para-hydroxybenzoate--polyprenyltransferase, mitochondrial precursor (PHB:polyprenyltransferase) [Vermiconidia calcicola]|uniref:Para-hydroxybenzoate--polyprenyltransferase, mitochondrial (PHB:polyprenyltransferase) n=1 Tax=Vermiconidia calcicola TaxID=1690605 RepID=A0ACC3NC66_9PEZI|nr:Para-hydroxybenzoate--polyprenyltransferase, mitochondrial precursor (PHB:polyprenyltransferase) [Vermiconidia calcicola]